MRRLGSRRRMRAVGGHRIKAQAGKPGLPEELFKKDFGRLVGIQPQSLEPPGG